MNQRTPFDFCWISCSNTWYHPDLPRTVPGIGINSLHAQEWVHMDSISMHPQQKHPLNSIKLRYHCETRADFTAANANLDPLIDNPITNYVHDYGNSYITPRYFFFFWNSNGIEYTHPLSLKCITA